MKESPEWILVGMIKRIHGPHGEMLVMPFTDHAEERFKAGSVLYLSRKRHEERLKVRTASSRFSHRGPVIVLEGYGSREKALPLFGANLFIRAADLAAPEAGSYYSFQVEGCEVYAGRQLIGKVAGLEETPRANPYLKVDPGEGKPLVLIPFVSDVVRSVDLDARRIEIIEDFLG
ncbi:MAG: 16S rRNA processing protein RimM [Thermoleophilia bacterium]|nr:16S rRNA processing protein RimM [Thermoleophilia bacterium]